MLFSKREPLTPAAPSFTQRFSSKLGQYLAPSNPRDVKQPKQKPSLNINACTAILGEKTDNTPFKLTDTQAQLRKLSNKYQKKTGQWLELEQLALVVLKINAYKQAKTLKHQAPDHCLSECTLLSHTPTSTLRLALIADALNITSFSDTTAQVAVSKFKACRHMLSVLLSDVSMQDLETYCRGLKESCSEAMAERGADMAALQSSWQLRMSYLNSNHSLLLKCMPLDMLRDTFQEQYKAQYGQTKPNKDITIESLEVTVQNEDDTPPGAPTRHADVDFLMQSWLPDTANNHIVWSKILAPSMLEDSLDYLACPILHKLLTPYVTEQADISESEFFIQKM